LKVLQNIKTTISKFFTTKFSKYKVVEHSTNQISLWGNTAYNNDIVRGCVNAKALRVSKVSLRHIQKVTNKDNSEKLNINPWPYMKFILEEPNRYMTIAVFLQKISVLCDLTGNAFILILRDTNGIPCELFPIMAISAEAKHNADGALFYDLTLKNGERWRFADYDIVHIRGDFYLNDIFGDSREKSLSPLLEVVETTDRGIINAIKNSSIVRWLLKYSTALRDEDLKKNAQAFADNYLNISSGTVGVAATDAKADAIQVNPQDYVPNAAQMSKSTERLMNIFNTNIKIITSSANEDEENEYYETVIEPFVIKISQELTRKLFSRRQRSTGNFISAGSFNLQAASLKTKLALVSMVDRGALTPNEWREAMGLTPKDGCDKPIRRLDTATVNTTKDNEGSDEAIA
jgi:HK97 family phage portal protein